MFINQHKLELINFQSAQNTRNKGTNWDEKVVLNGLCWINNATINAHEKYRKKLI